MKRIIFSVLFSVLLTNLSAQKVGVVLSGGGAKGVTHIGVLKALEEAGIPIDYIAGTSMGAIIGGLYASGYSPEDMIKIINSEEFTKWVSGKLDPEYIYFFRQPYPNASWFNFKFKIDSTIQTRIPTNIVSPVRMDFAFLDLFSQASAAAKYNYDSLLIPFRCVASDIRANKPYVMSKGDLGSSIRASMTFPFYFKPIRIDGRLLFDGGMYNNFPSDIVLKDFFPDIIIGSKAAGNYSPPEEDNVLSQLTSMLMNETDYDVYCNASILIEPKLKPTNLIDFSHTQAFIDSGYIATIRLIPQIRQFVLDTVTQAMHNQIRSRFNSRKPEMLINTIQVNGLQQGQASYVVNAIMGARTIKNKKGSHSYDLSIDQVKKGYFKILGENRLKSAFPTLVYDPKSQRYRFVIDAQYDNTIMAEFGGSVSSGATNEIFLQLQYNHWRKIAASASVNGYFGRFYNSVYVGASTEIPGSRPWTFETSFTFNQFNYFRTNTYFFIDKSPAYLAQNETYGRSAFGLPMGNKGRFELGITYGRNRDDYFQTNEYTKEDTLDKTYLEYYSPYFQIEKNTLNRKQYSNIGMRFYASVHYISGNEEQYPGSTSLLKGDYTKHHDYMTFNLSYEAYFAKRFVYKPGILIDLQLNALQNVRNFTSALLLLPAYTPVYEMLTQFQPEYRATGFASFGFRNVFTLYKNLDLRLEGYAFAPLREVRSDAYRRAVYSDLFPSIKYIASGCLVYQTPLGPLSISLNKYDDGSPVSFFMNLGFIIFNRSSIK